MAALDHPGAAGPRVPDPRYVYPDHALGRLAGDNLTRFLLWAADAGASDITVQTDLPPKLHVHGRIHNALPRPVASDEMARICAELYNINAIGTLAKGVDIDCALDVRRDRERRQRFRVNITAGVGRGQTDYQATLRVLPSRPPRLADLGVEQAVLDAYRPHDGLVLVTGTTGSGKSTLLAAMVHEMLLDPDTDRKILEYSAPVEYVYHDVESPYSFVHQVDIAGNLPSFAAAVRNGMRRVPSVVLVGEARDAETMAACVEGAQTGHTVYSTLHTGGVIETIRRMVSIFPAAERQDRAFSLMEQMRLVINQSLLPAVDGRRVAAREILVFDEETRFAFLAEGDLSRWPVLGRRLLQERGQTMEQAVSRLRAEGRISELVAGSRIAAVRSAARAAAPVREESSP